MIVEVRRQGLGAWALVIGEDGEVSTAYLYATEEAALAFSGRFLMMWNAGIGTDPRFRPNQEDTYG